MYIKTKALNFIKYVLPYNLNRRMYKYVIKRIKQKMGNTKYGIIQVEGCHFAFNVADICIPREMYCTNSVWAANDIRRFFVLAKKYREDIKPDSIFLDIGANIGTTCVYYNKVVNPLGKAIAFEPDKDNYELLKTNILLNKCTNILTCNLGLSDSDACYVMEKNVNSFGENTIIKNKKKPTNLNEQIIKTTSLDKYLYDAGISDKVGYLWIDVEGFEGEVIAGAESLIKKNKPVLYMEFTPWQIKSNHSFSELDRILGENYRGIILPGGKMLKMEDLRTIYVEKRDIKWQTDLFIY